MDFRDGGPEVLHFAEERFEDRADDAIEDRVAVLFHRGKVEVERLEPLLLREREDRMLARVREDDEERRDSLAEAELVERGRLPPVGPLQAEVAVDLEEPVGR